MIYITLNQMLLIGVHIANIGRVHKNVNVYEIIDSIHCSCSSDTSRLNIPV